MELELTGFGEFEGVELLQKLTLFQKLTFDETSRLGGIIQYMDVPAETIVIEQNALGDALYIIARGEVRISRDADQDGQHSASEVSTSSMSDISPKSSPSLRLPIRIPLSQPGCDLAFDSESAV